MQDTEADVAEIHDLERKIEALQQEEANFEMNNECMQIFLVGLRKEAAKIKAQNKKAAARKKSDADLLTNLKAKNDMLTKLQFELTTAKCVEVDLEKLGTRFEKLMELQSEDEVNKILCPMNEFLEKEANDGEHWKMLEKQSKVEQNLQDVIRAQIESAKKDKIKTDSEHLKEMQTSKAKIIRRMHIQKKVISKFQDTLKEYEDHQKQLTELDNEIAELQKRFDESKKQPTERAVETAPLAPMTPPLKLAPIELVLDHFKDPNEFLPKNEPAKKSQDTPRPFKTTGSYGELLPKILKMDKKSHIVQKKSAKTSAKKLFSAKNKTKNDLLAQIQPPDAETQPPVAETQPPVAETQPTVAETQPTVAETQSPVPETQSPVAVISEQAPASIETEPAAQVLEENESVKNPTIEPTREESVNIPSEIESPGLAERQAIIQSKSPQRTPSNAMETDAQTTADSGTESEMANEDFGPVSVENTTNRRNKDLELSQEMLPESSIEDHATASVENPMNNDENGAEGTLGTLPDSQTPGSGEILNTPIAENLTNEQDQGLPQEKSQLSASTPAMSSPSCESPEVISFQIESPIVEKSQENESPTLESPIQSPASKLQQCKLDSMLGSEAFGNWDLDGSDGVNNIFGPIVQPNSNAKPDKPNENDDLDFFASNGATPNEFFGNGGDDNPNSHLSLF